jgi:hypothetical protein
MWAAGVLLNIVEITLRSTDLAAVPVAGAS